MNIRPFYSGTVSEKKSNKKNHYRYFFNPLTTGMVHFLTSCFFNDMGNWIADIFQKHEKKQVDHEKKICIDATKTWKRKPLVNQS